MSSSRAGIFAVIALSTAAGCTLLLADDLNTGGRAGPAVTTDASDAAGSDVADEQRATDAGRPETSCPGTFCDSFDDRPLGALWDEQTIVGGTLDLVPTPFTSPPRSLRSVLPTGGTTPWAAQLKKTLGSGSAIACAFDLQVVQAPTARHADVIRFSTTAPGVTAYALIVALENEDRALSIREDVHFEDGGCGCPRRRSDLPPLSSDWHHVEVWTDFAMASLQIDGVERFRGAMGVITPGDVRISLGLFGYGSALEPSAYYDGLVCTVTP